jgi:hypothetical protein
VRERKKQPSVAVIFEAHARKQIEALANLMPVWVVESAENNAAAEDVRRKCSAELTVFVKRESESKEDMLARVIYDVDDHHRFDRLFLYGAMLADIDPEVVAAMKFTNVESTDYGCQLIR